MTFDEAAKLDPDTHAGELDAGRWVPVTKNTWRHGQLIINVSVLLKTYAKSHPGWSVSAGDPGTKLGRDPDVLRGPDVAMVREERVPKGTGVDGWLDGAPDLVVEVRGDSQPYTELTRKAIENLRAGAKIVWVLDGAAQEVAVFTPPDHVRVLGRDEALEAEGLLPGFRCLVSDLFE
jgi:Uma2 family endonuclease